MNIKGVANLILTPKKVVSLAQEQTISSEDKQHMYSFLLLYLSSAEEATTFTIKLTKYLY